MGLDASTKQAVETSFRDMLTAYSTGRIDEAMSMASSDEDIVLVEPGPDQIWVGRAKVREGIQFDWDTTEGEMPIELRQTWVSGEGNVAWITGETKINLKFHGKDMDLEGRFTAVAKREGGAWKWHTIHFGAPDPRQTQGQAWPDATAAGAG